LSSRLLEIDSHIFDIISKASKYFILKNCHSSIFGEIKIEKSKNVGKSI